MNKKNSPIANGFNAVRVESGGWIVSENHHAFAGAAFTNTRDLLDWLQRQLEPENLDDIIEKYMNGQTVDS